MIVPADFLPAIYTGPGRGQGKVEGRVACECIQAAGGCFPASTFSIHAGFSEYKVVGKLENFMGRSV